MAVAWCALAAARAALGAGWPEAFPPLPASVSLPLGLLWVPIVGIAVGATSNGRTRASIGEIAADVARGVAIGVAIGALAAFALRIEVNRSLVLGFAGSAVPALVAGRALLAAIGLGGASLRAVVVGDPESAARLVHSLRARRQPVDVVAIPTHDTLADTLNAHPTDEVYLAGLWPPDDRGGALADIARLCDDRGVPLLLDANFLAVGTASVTLAERDGWTAIRLAQAPIGLDQRFKRVVDVVGAVVGLAVFAPVTLAAMALIAATDGRPVLFRQRRLGRHGRPFTMYKLRTMVPDAERAPAPPDKRGVDPRVTSIGRWLRRLSIDELPQLVNVLRGEMSLVGPRPPLPAEVERYERWQLRRLSAMPGMTGLWQVSGRADLPVAEGIALDLAYIDRWTVWLDVALLFRTVPAVIRGTGAR